MGIACADKGQPAKAKAGSSAPATTPTGSAAPRQVTIKNYCSVGPAKDGAKQDARTNNVLVSVVLDGVYNKEDEQIYVFGKCNYVSGAGRVENYERLHTWNCEFKSYLTGFPPNLIEHDVRGNPELEDWYGKLPQPIVNSPDTSEDPVRIAELSIRGPGTFAINCPRDRPHDDLDRLKGCRISWYNKFIPDEAHYVGVCGETVKVRGVYEDPPAP
jgi:hypothetical protein